MENKVGKFYIVATPIGNLDDITYRAVEVLRSVDVIMCEDTRVTKKLLQAYGINRPVSSYQQHSRDKDVENIIMQLQQGRDLAYVTDAGTPGISDPGNRLVAKVTQDIPEVNIIPLPGPSAVITALSISGFPTDEFLFLGFIPHKKGRQKFFKEIATCSRTVVFFESVYRIQKLLNEMIVCLPERAIVVTRELTKQFETVYRGCPSDVLAKLQQDIVKGEFVVVVRGV